MTKITANLRWKELTQTYSFMPITVKGETINPFEEAIKDGTIKALIKECADAMHGGDMAPVVKQLIQNCQSKICVDKTKSVKNSTQRAGEAAVAMFLDYLVGIRNELGGTGTGVRPAGRAKWAITAEEIDAMTDAAALGKIVDCMASHKAKDLTDKPELTDDDELFLENYARARAKLKELKAGSKATVEVSENLLAKLTKGGKAILSSAEVAELLKVLGK